VVSLLLVLSLVAPHAALAQPPAPAPTPAVPPATPPTALPVPVPAPTFVFPPQVRPILGSDYRLGNGDLVEVQVAGRLEVIRQQVTVDPEGTINVPPLGTIPVGGLTLAEAHRRVAERARALYRYADVAVSVVTPRAFEIVVSGEVERPGAMIVTATRRLHDVIREVGGITPRGSQRRVQVTRNGVAREVDLLAFELRGDIGQNPLVEEGTRIHVPPRTGAVALLGAVRRPGEYELGPDGSLRALLDLVGGLGQAAAGSDTRLTRVGLDGRKETTTLDLRTAVGPERDVRLQPGDTLFVPPIAVLQDVVEVRGAFTGTPESSRTTVAGKATIVQRFELAQGERVRDVVAKAGGAAAFADLRLAVIERGGSHGPRQRIPIDLHRLLVEKDETHNILLQNGDVLSLPVIEDKVYVVGEVKSPGAVDFRPNLTPREYVTLAGGPAVRARLVATTVTFRDGQTYPMSEAPPLEPGAVVTVPEVAVRWWQDYAQIATVVAGLVSAYTGLFITFGGTLIRGRTEPKPIYE
jgi:protein involved in polysaccharide export with SLBB domain